MKLYSQRIFVDDLAAAKRFYGETLGLPQLWEWGGIAVGYDVGAVLIVELEELEEGEETVVGRFIGCTLTVDNIDAVYADLRAKDVSFLGPPEYMAWGGTLTYFRDPAGNVLALMGSARQH
jgi:catechol 2,3-dioxygenase-like lactoylglutathione lyase family enzyme